MAKVAFDTVRIANFFQIVLHNCCCIKAADVLLLNTLCCDCCESSRRGLEKGVGRKGFVDLF